MFLLILLLGSLSGHAAGADLSSSFNGIIQQVTEEKLEELRIQKNLMTDHFSPVLENTSDSSKEPREILQIYYDAVKASPIKDIIDNTLIENLKEVLKNSVVDPSLTQQLFSSWNQKIQQEIERALRKCQYSFYFGCLLTEWLAVEERKQTQSSIVSSEAAKVAKKNAVSNVSKIMFNLPPDEEFNSDTFKQYLDKEFFNATESTDIDNLIKKIRKEASEFLDVETETVYSTDVQSCVEGLLSEELLTEAKKTALRQLKQNSETLTEVASLLTNRLRNIDRWEWPNSTLANPVDVRRGAAGEYKVYLNEDILTSLFLQYVGVRWAAFFKQRFLEVYYSKMWVRVTSDYGSIEYERNQFQRRAFLSALPDSLESQKSKNPEEYVKIQSSPAFVMKPGGGRGASGAFKAADSADYEEEAGQSFAKVPHAQRLKAKPRTFLSTTVRPPPQKPDIDIKQSFLHVLSIELRLHQVIFPDNPVVVLQADIEEFGPSINHEAVLIVMEKFGVSERWLDFFKTFLQPQVKFSAKSESRQVVRGIPTSHALSNLFGETLMFVLESVINKKCDGMRIYRIADEIWFFNKDQTHVKEGWKALNTFGSMVGLKVNSKRSGSVKVYGENSSQANLSHPGPKPLPQKNIHWGYLELHSDATFRIDENSITKFLEEMNGLLGKAECTLEWIQIFNKYMAFFVRNFGKGALVLGTQHFDQISDSLRTIYAGVFGSLDTSPVNLLKESFKELPDADLLDAWIYWPLEMGGLGLTDPFIGITALRKAYHDINDEELFTKIPLEDKIHYDELVAEHEKNYGTGDGGQAKGGKRPLRAQATEYGEFVGIPPPKLPTWEEYISTRETDLGHWFRRYLRLLERPSPHTPKMAQKFWQLGSQIPNEEPARNYFMWLYNYFEPQLELYFGTSTFINSELLPKSIIENIQKAKLKY